ncbi:pectinacetylesterase family protein [Stylonychia lemnae]|uniref:Pectinacetylesterase family protein n=1 Tax=Stylonychia lemnae TaxID=5949 RepID=A0A078AYP8_STYLE|nr:pectinacetylesterase family protein [Stylonychia lemnae]|eukprot:CDW87261.1 pectinacetylesterase family protein [Stylonychia lemnae]
MKQANFILLVSTSIYLVSSINSALGNQDVRGWGDVDPYAPDAWDWTTQPNIISPVRSDGLSQNINGWASIVVSAIESHYALKYGKQRQLSVQQLLDCTQVQEESINPWTGYTTILMAGGIADSKSYPATESKSKCYYNLSIPSVNLQGDGYQWMPQNETKLKSVVYNQGPVVVAMAASKDFFSYTGGIFNTTTCNGVVPTIALLLVGYGEENGVPYWIAQSALGENWGEKGYARILRDQSLCLIDHVPTIPYIILDPELEYPRPYQYMWVAIETEARCIDGSFATIYFSQGYGDGLTKAITFFEGGGWCYGRNQTEVKECLYERSSTDLGSSNNYPQTNYLNRTFFEEPEQDLLFSNWNRFFINYCDGAGHQGYKKDPIVHKDKSLYLRGELNTKAHLDFILSKLPPEIMTDFVLSGCSAGGLASLMWTDYFKDKILTRNPKVKYTAMPDSGFFVDYKSVLTNDNDYKIKMDQLYLISNAETNLPNSNCLNNVKPEDKNTCFFAENAINYIKSDVLVLQSGYDVWQISNILGISCLDSEYGTLIYACNNTQIKQIQDFREYTVKILRDKATKLSNIAVWSPSCPYHCYYVKNTQDLQAVQVPMNSGNNVALAFIKVRAGQRDSYNWQWIDNVQWPQNTACAFYLQECPIS